MVYSQNVKLIPTRQSSLETFSKGNYEDAFKEFQQLLITYPKDPLYKYYSGVCLVLLGQKPDEAVDFLTQALKGAPTVRTLPSDAYFYLGRAQQMAGDFEGAIGSYNFYTDQAGKKAAKTMGVPDFIGQCKSKTGKIEGNKADQRRNCRERPMLIH